MAGTGKGSFQDIMSRGLLYGTDYDVGDAYRGVWASMGVRLHLASHLPCLQHGRLARNHGAMMLMERNVRCSTRPSGVSAMPPRAPSAGRAIATTATVPRRRDSWQPASSSGIGDAGHERSRVLRQRRELRLHSARLRADRAWQCRVYVRLFGQHALGIQFVGRPGIPTWSAQPTGTRRRKSSAWSTPSSATTTSARSDGSQGAGPVTTPANFAEGCMTSRDARSHLRMQCHGHNEPVRLLDLCRWPYPVTIQDPPSCSSRPLVHGAPF